MDLLQVEQISRKENDTYQLNDISFTQKAFQKMAIAGATGSGKTTLLKIIAGLVQPNAGEVLLEGLRVKGPEEKLIPGYTLIAYLSQHFELLHHYRVEEILQMTNKLSDEEAAMIYEICRIDHLLKRGTHQLSGGEKQRIALARLLVSSPRLLLLDEPFSNLDVLHKNLLKSVIDDIGEHLKITCMLVSHDPADTLSWADEIIVLMEGKIVQQASPFTIYKQPVNEYTAALFGKFNLLQPTLLNSFSALAAGENKQISQFMRPEDFQLSAENRGLAAEVKAIRFMGSHYEIETEICGQNLMVRHHQNHLQKGDRVFISLC